MTEEKAKETSTWGLFFSFPKCHAKLRMIGDKNHAITIESPCHELEQALKDPIPPPPFSSEPTADLEITEKTSWFFQKKDRVVYSEENLPANNAVQILKSISNRYG